MEIKFRPHHFLCALGFEGKGYSTGFVRNFWKVAKHLREEDGDDTVIEVTYGLDNICGPCPHNMGTKCDNQAKIDELDKNHREVLNLKEGEKLTWGEAKQRIKQHMTIEKHHQVCAKCEWLKYGICEKHLKNLRGEEA